jgi:hypothetical protein
MSLAIWPSDIPWTWNRYVGSFCELMGAVVSKSVLDAIREGDWYFEPEDVDCSRFRATHAIPGTQEKLDVLAARARAGLPLWHDGDRADYEQVQQQL